MQTKQHILYIEKNSLIFIKKQHFLGLFYGGLIFSRKCSNSKFLLINMVELCSIYPLFLRCAFVMRKEYLKQDSKNILKQILYFLTNNFGQELT